MIKSMKQLGLVAAMSMMGVGVNAAPVADKIYSGGPILTMSDQAPNAQALAVKDGKILAVGTLASIEKAHKGPSTIKVDLQGNTLSPGFVDGHSHFLGFGAQAVGANLLAPPDGTVNTIDDLVAKLQTFAKGSDVNRTGWIFGLGYDDALLGRHPTRDDLDKVSKDIPVIAVHISGHFSAMNSAGLAKVGYTAQTKNPDGGVIRRYPGSSEPNGVLEELASIPVMIPAINAQKAQDKDYFIAKGLELAKSFGYTTISEGRLMAFQQPELESAAKRGLLDIDVISFADYTAKDVLPLTSPNYQGRYRVGGMKITLDGSPQGRTAWCTVPYLLPPDGQQAGYKGYPALANTKDVENMLEQAYTKGWTVKVHTNGDAAIDQLFEALKPVIKRHGVKPGQVVMIHGQFIRQDQVKQLKPLGIFPSMFPMHTFYWGDWYHQIVGPKRAEQISPMRSILNTGLHVTSHTDAPVALPNLMQVMWATVNRVSRSGAVIGADERVTQTEAMKMITLWGAEQFGEQAKKGSLEAGKLADMVILSANPLAVDPMDINKIQVMETIKEGNSIYRRK